jgi:hypothetical protein
MLGLSTGYRNAYQVHGTSDLGDKYKFYTGITIGLGAVSVGFMTESIIRIIRYTHTASKSIPAQVK